MYVLFGSRKKHNFYKGTWRLRLSDQRIARGMDRRACGVMCGLFAYVIPMRVNYMRRTRAIGMIAATSFPPPLP